MKAIQTKFSSYLLKQLPQATAFIDTKNKLVVASDSWLKIFDGKETDFIGKNVLPIYESHAAIDPEILNESLSGFDSEGIRHKKILDKNTTLWYKSTFSPWFDDKENVLGTIIQTDDITAQVKTELELERMKTLFKEKSEVAKVGCWEYDIESEHLFWCEETKKIHAVPPSYTPNVSDGIEFYKKGYSRNTISMLFHKAVEQGTPFSERLTIVTKDGKELWVRASGKPIFENGQVVKLFGTFQDINDQVVAELKREEHERLMTTLIDNIPLNVFIKDTDSRKILVNKAECEYLGKSAEELLGKSDFDLYDRNIAQISRDEDVEVMRTQTPILGRETISIKKNGQTTNFLTSKIPLFDLEGNVTGLMGISMDITHLKKKESQLRKLINVTAIQNKKLINFAHIVSHNLRSHSANLAMLLKFLREENQDIDEEEVLEMLTKASGELMQTLEDLNKVLEINTNINLKKEHLNVNEMVGKIKQDIAVLLENNQVKIENHIPEDFKVHAVPEYLESILMNLLTNAVKYRNPERRPIITLKMTRRSGNCILSVSDNGLGINLDKFGNRVFGMYKTFHKRKDSRGLGLYLIKNQIEAMGGSIGLESIEGKGSTFKVYFPEER